METGPWLKDSSNRLVKPRIEPATPDLHDKRFIHYNTVALNTCSYCIMIHCDVESISNTNSTVIHRDIRQLRVIE